MLPKLKNIENTLDMYEIERITTLHRSMIHIRTYSIVKRSIISPISHIRQQQQQQQQHLWPALITIHRSAPADLDLRSHGHALTCMTGTHLPLHSSSGDHIIR